MQRNDHGKMRLVLPGAALALMMAGSPCLALNAFADPSEAPTQAATKTVTSSVYDSEGEPLIGATVMVKGTSTGAATDIDGKFTLTCAPNATLVISYVGFKSQEIKVSNLPDKIVLDSDNDTLDELVVIGYGTTTRKAAVGAVDQVKGDKIKDRPVKNMTQALQGAAPNVIIQNRSYDPNSDDANFNIRGISTTSGNDPLFVIDGVIADNGAFNRLNPNDVENISVLKDAGAAAIYGSRSSNGVILVTTKSGKKNQKSQITLSANVGWEDPKNLYHAVDGYANAILWNTANVNAGKAPVFTPEQIKDLYDHRDMERWALDEIYETAFQQKYNVQVSGGTESTTYMFSLGYYDQDSNLKGHNNTGKQRYNMRMNIGTDIGRLHLGAIMGFTRSDSKKFNGYEGNVYADCKRIPSYYYYNMIDEEGRYMSNDVYGSGVPIAMLDGDGYNKYRNNDFDGSLTADLKIIEGLKLRGSMGANVHTEFRESKWIPWMYYDQDYNYLCQGTAKDYKSDSWSKNYWLLNSQIMLDFNRTFGDHNVIALIGLTNESTTRKEHSYWFNYADPELWKPTDQTNSEVGNIGGNTPTTSNARTSITSVIGRAGYNWKSRYFAEFTFRYDGSSKFHKDHRWGFFPSVSLAWRPTEESFLDLYRQNIGDLKIRGSWGILGNQAVGDYAYITTYNPNANGYVINNQLVTSAGFSLKDPNLTWEKTHSWDIGFDATFLRGALTVAFDYFYKKTVDILQTPQFPGIYGTSVPNTNMGKMSNQGWELSVNYYLTTGKWHHSFAFNLGDTHNKMLSFPGHYQIAGDAEAWRVIQEGKPVNDYYGYKVIGMFQSYEEIEKSATPPGLSLQPGDLKFKDVNGDGIIDQNDRVALGSAFPRYTFGFNYGLEWKGFDFSMFLQGVGKRTQFIRGEMIEPFHVGYALTMYKHQLDFWTPTNTDAKYPRLSTNGTDSNENNYRMGNSLNMLNGAYVRLKNVQIGYTLPESVNKLLGMQKCRIYVNGENLLTFSHNSWIDPEVTDFNSNMGNSGDNSYRAYPTLKYYGFGLDVTF